MKLKETGMIVFTTKNNSLSSSLTTEELKELVEPRLLCKKALEMIKLETEKQTQIQNFESPMEDQPGWPTHGE